MAATAFSNFDVSRIQRRVVPVLVLTQIVGGVGVAVGISVGALLAAAIGGAGISGLASSASVIGGALLALPATRLMRTAGRRPGLVFAYLVGAVGAAVVVLGAVADSLVLVFVGMALFGGGTAANLQARYAAVDLAEPARRGRQLSFVVWATTVGAVTGPNVAPLADRVTTGRGIPEYSGPFVFSAIAFGLAALLLFILLRPDPLQTARAVLPPPPVEPGGTATPAATGFRVAWRAVLDTPRARLGVAAVAVGHLVMVGVMSMTPVHIGAGGHDHAAVLRIVGIVLSVHIAGMYALSPVVGWLTDRLGRRAVIGLGIALLLAACAVAGTAGHHAVRLSIGLALLGLGWSSTMVAGSTLLSESVEPAVRPAAQGLNDLVMGVGGASAAALSGLVVQVGGYPTLTLLSAIATLPLIALALRPGR